MKILYIQNSDKSILSDYGISDCYLKHFSDMFADKTNVTDKWHCHNDFEIHILTKGFQVYETKEELINISSGQCFVIPPGVYHRINATDESAEKITLYFKYNYKTNPLFFLDYQSCFLIDTPKNAANSLDNVIEEVKNRLKLSDMIIENRLLEIIINFFRVIGNKETVVETPKTHIPCALVMAQCYIENNIQSAPTISDVAAHCNISTRQLLRLFLRYEGISAADYIKNKRIEAIQKLLSDKTLSIRFISEKMNFSSEYYMNAYFKKFYGLPPGRYRKML